MIEILLAVALSLPLTAECPADYDPSFWVPSCYYETGSFETCASCAKQKADSQYDPDTPEHLTIWWSEWYACWHEYATPLTLQEVEQLERRDRALRTDFVCPHPEC